MKKAYTFTVLLFIAGFINLKAQSKQAFHGAQNFHNVNSGNRHFTKYAASALYDSIYYWTFDTTASAWDFNAKEVKIIYNAGNKISSQLVQNWNGSSWINFTIDTFYYNSNTIDTADIEQAWTGTKWENEYWYSYTYNASDSETSEVERIWTGSAWRNYQKYTYIYDANNNMTNLLAQQWNGSNWAFSYHYKYTFNSNNLVIMLMDSTAASTERWLYNYNVNNLLVDDSSQYRFGSGWVTDFNYIYTYDANNSDTSEVIQQWTGSAWAGYEKYTYTWDATKNMIGRIYYTWNGNATEKFQQFVYTYDVNNVMLSEEMKQFFDAGTRVIMGDSTYWYFHKIAGTNNIIANGDILVYPNPNIGKFTIQTSDGKGKISVEIYNVLGENVYQNQIPNNSSPVSVSLNVPDGLYFLLIRTGQGELNRKIIIHR